ncbi:MAG: SurA N-terminal domain-containing protein [Candidatus Pelagibacterales bacterium]|tara:strand:- start:1054 stop:1665 length:612 start_codon:yes stop_codon:yes gene_type:complete
MIKKFKFLFLVSFSLIISNYSIQATGQSYKIIALVNDQVITNYDLEKRLQLVAFLNDVTINADNIDLFAEEMLKLMIDEKLQIEEAEKYNINLDDSEISNYMKNALLKPGQSLSYLTETLEKNNIDINVLKETIYIKLAWNELSARLYYRTAEINDTDLENEMQNNLALSTEQARNILIQKQIELRAKKLLRDLRSEANIENR